MTTTTETVGDLLVKTHGGWAGPLGALENGPVQARLLQQVATDGLLSALGAFRSVAARIPDLVKVDLGVLFVGGCKKMQELRRYTDAAKYGPEKTMLVELTQHTLKSVHKPTLDVLVSGKKVDTVEFELRLTATFDGAVLTVRDGKIHAVSPGACKLGGELKCEGYTIVKRESAPARLPVAWTFKEPIEIPH